MSGFQTEGQDPNLVANANLGLEAGMGRAGRGSSERCDGKFGTLPLQKVSSDHEIQLVAQ